LANTWEEPVWYIKSLRATGSNSIRWDRQLSDGSRLTDPPHQHLLEIARQFLRILLDDPQEMLRIDAHSTALARASVLLIIIEWMHARAIARFRDISPSVWSEYRALVVWGSAAILGRDTLEVRRRITADRILEHFRVWQHLRDFHVTRLANGSLLLTDGLSFEPFLSGKDAVFLARQLGAETGTTKSIPTQTALFAINAAIEWVVYHGDELIRLRKAGETESSRELKRLKAHKRASQELVERSVGLQVQAWLTDPESAPTYAGKISRTKLANLIGVHFTALYHTESHRTLLETFDRFLSRRDPAVADPLARRCAEILGKPIPETERSDIARSRLSARHRLLPYSGSVTTIGGPWPIMVFGAGPKEARSLEAAHVCLWSACFLIIGVFMADRLEEIRELEDDCIVRRPDGAYLRNRTWKEAGTEAGEEGLRPCPQIVARTVDVLLRIKKSTGASSKWLFAIPHRGGQTLPDETTIRKRLELFGQWIGLSADEREPWSIRPHQLRRFFAITWVWFYEFGPDLLALKTFLRQRDLDTCARYAKSATRGEVLSQRKSLTGFVLERAAFKGLEVKGGFGNYLKRFFSKLRLTVGNPAKISREIERLQQKINLTLRPSPWGYCAWASGRSKYAQCAISAGVENPTAPVEWARTPYACSECANFLTHEGFREFWQAEAERHSAVLTTPNISIGLRAAAEEGIQDGRDES
jgi:hypothetical protein